MIIRELVLHNFGVYASTNRFVFHGDKPIVLIAGMNGRGKTTILDAIDTEVAANVTAADEAVNKNFIYFSKTKNGTGTTTYSFVSVDGKSTLPAGLVKCPVSSLSTSDGSVDASAAAFVFTTYITNNGKYAVKIIKIVA